MEKTSYSCGMTRNFFASCRGDTVQIARTSVLPCVNELFSVSPQ
jgi:hypothetical protein